MSTNLSDRVRALERAVTDRDAPPRPIPDISDVASDQSVLESRLSALETDVRDLEARQQAVEAYVDQVSHVNDAIERRADAALAAVDRLESRVKATEHDDREPGTLTTAAADTSRSSWTDSPQSTHVPDAASDGAVTGEHTAPAADTMTVADAEVDTEKDPGFMSRLLGL